MIPGKKINLGGTEYEIPALTLGQMRRLAAEVEIVREAPRALANMTEEERAAASKVIHAALSRSYSLSEEELAELLDAGSMFECVLAVLYAAGLREVEGAAPMGEAVPVAEPSAVASPRFMPLSPPAAATPTA